MRKLINTSAEKLKLDTTKHQFLRHSVNAIIYLIGISLAIYTIPSLRNIASSLLAGAGIAGIAIGFAAKDALGNIIGGVFIIVFKPFKIGSRIQIQALNGTVEDITLRHTVIRNFQNKRIIIPNAIVSNEIIINSNLVDDKICKWIEVGISYDSDIDFAKELMASEILKHPLLIDNRTELEISNGTPQVHVRVILLGDFSVTLRAWAWANNASDAFIMECDILESLKKRFDKEGIEIPFPYRTIVHKNQTIETKIN
ncbi:mechanosensitive ion channel family protein [Urechidicola sp. KH5]